jgi:hypothetical protein
VNVVDAVLSFVIGFGGTAATLALWAIAMELGRIRRLLRDLTSGVHHPGPAINAPLEPPGRF